VFVWNLSYAACNAHVPHYVAIWGLPDCTVHLHIISKTARFSKEVIES